MQATSSTQAWTTTILDDCHHLVLTHLHESFKRMFENSDAAFREFIDKAQSNASQIRFMEAMGIINKNRTYVEQTFCTHLGRGFRHFNTLKYAASLAAAQRSEPLTLVSKEDTDIQVALQNMTSSAAMGSTHVLYAIRQRLSVLNNGRKLDEDQVPAGPHALADAFHEAAKELMLDHETLLIVYMLFDKFVLSRTAPMYEAYNERLLKAGLLPNLKYEVQKQPHRVQQRDGSSGQYDGTPSPHQAGATSGQSLGDELFNNILQLLSRRDRQGHDSGGGADGTAIPEPLPQEAVVSAIHRLQLSRHSEPVDVPAAVADITGVQRDRRIVKTMLAQLTDEREQLFSGLDRRRLPSADTQVIDLVGMMFEYLLNDKNLPSVAKAELCRLHTPYLKVAIIDKSLFTNVRHPAHELLNMLASAGAKWVFEDDPSRGIFPTMRMIIQRIIEEFENNIELFDELLALCRSSIHDLENKATAIEQRTRQAAAGKEKLELARACAADTIDSRMAGRNIPAELCRMMEDTWLDKLMFIYLREPESEFSTTWSLAVQTIDSILWSVEPRKSDEARDELREKLPTLRRKIERAFEMLDAYGASDNDAQLALIEGLQDAALDATAETGPGPEPASAIAASGPPAAPAMADSVTQESGPADTGGHAPPGTPTPSPEVEAALTQIEDLSFGTWFSFAEDETASPVRLKLSWFSQMSGNYMFVDSMGVRAAVKNRIELATLLADGRIRIINEEKQSFVQRAMVAIRRMLSSHATATA
jgi:hypothetical protein